MEREELRAARGIVRGVLAGIGIWSLLALMIYLLAGCTTATPPVKPYCTKNDIHCGTIVRVNAIH